ncbi:PhoD-like phosphatase [Kamptonema sp. UHCC 0994]|uniref:PhoD-like phosphatase n=1 Tax=Kamptonema sp. UHCC 0994 TaxID=3031329 RepID=UPI0023B9506E|nr:PhoD-like phosphatase [Kamptonema sp. UHCC 0994]MDF0555729.1 PhoD-like phosphatase [Kamptonema sp. UHCC 0994]
MSQTPLSHRLNQLPLILGGPILRRTENRAVTVWLALKEASEVTIGVYATVDGKGQILGSCVLEGARSAVKLGKYLYVVAVTAKPVNDCQLESGQVYAYDLSFSCSPQISLNGALGIEGPETGFFGQNTSLEPTDSLKNQVSLVGVRKSGLSYFDHQLPTFALPPEDLNHLRIVHGSCRKPHGGGCDALPILDDLIQEYAGEANFRPHQLFFTGDQIYGDDVADPLLWAVTEAGDVLLGWGENLPLNESSQIQEKLYKKPSELKPGDRSDIARDFAGFTAMLVNKPDKAKSHLFSLGEYYAMYLFAWSPILWPAEFPKGKDIYSNAKQAKLWDREVAVIEGFSRDLWRVRRAIANIPTYTICDDHDVSDDWYLNREWCDRVLSKALGRRTVQNAILAYAIFQAWGNTPDRFEEGQPGEKLLVAAKNWSESAGNDEFAWEEAAKYLGIPQLEPETGLPKFKVDEDVLVLDRDYADGTPILNWHYTIRSFKHEVIVLDTRTWRGYPKNHTSEPPMLLCHLGFEEQIQQPLIESDRLNESNEANIELTLVVLPTNLVSLSVIDMVQRWDLQQGKVFNSDAGDSWNFHEVGFTKLLTQLFKRRDRIVILTGDIHYAAAVRLNYWSKLDPTSNNKSFVLAQLTASAFKNAEWTTNFVHTKAKSVALEQPEDWAGWNFPPELVEIVVTPEIVRVLDVEVPKEGPILRQVQGTRGSLEIAWSIAIKDENSLPDWRYRIEWIKREKAEVASWIKRQELSNLRVKKNESIWFKNVEDVVSLIWRNRWLQEGEQIVGQSNFGLVSFQWPQGNNHQIKAVIQNIYWYPAWEPNSVVYSRYFVSLELEELPSLRRII